MDLNSMDFILRISIDYEGKRIVAQPLELEDGSYAARYQIGKADDAPQFMGCWIYVHGDFSDPVHARTVAVEEAKRNIDTGSV